jgi:hypothetical protein
MTRIHCGLRTAVIAAAIVVSGAGVYAQTPPHPPGHKHGTPGDTAAQVDPKARIASLDARIALLRADMMMFAGELKITAMTSLLDALVERQLLLDQEIRSMRERMRNRMDRDAAPVPPAELDPEAMCSPFI